MSVINQMLKDLDKRNAEQNEHGASPSVVVAQANNSRSPILMIFIGVVITLIIVAFIWLLQENKILKQHQAQSTQELQHQQQQANELVNAIKQLATDDNLAPLAGKKNAEKTAVVEAANGSALEAKNKVATNVGAEDNNSESLINARPKQQEPVSAERHMATDSELVVAQESATENSQEYPIESNSVNETVNKASTVKSSAPKPSLTIARKQLTPQELATQKLALAQKAMLENNGSKAEELLQDTLLLTPANKEARKQLAAIWFAKQQFQPALNLVNQGITLDGSEPDFRVMKAKILLQQNFPEDAYLALAPLADSANVDYQALLANAAQRANKTDGAIEAYKKLTQLQAYKAKWFLGLAIAFDKNGQFNSAVQAYKQAVALGDISAQSRQFAEQRIAELGDD